MSYARTLLVLILAFLASPAFAETGIASYYGWRENGRLMASGHPFAALGINAASRTLPMGTRVLVTNLANGRQAEVVILDRGPYVGHRIIDVSLGTARILGFQQQGLTRVRLEVLGRGVVRTTQRKLVKAASTDRHSGPLALKLTSTQ